jgi:hypothetical protein
MTTPGWLSEYVEKILDLFRWCSGVPLDEGGSNLDTQGQGGVDLAFSRQKE